MAKNILYTPARDNGVKGRRDRQMDITVTCSLCAAAECEPAVSTAAGTELCVV